MFAIGGKYELGERLGGGGMADVFRATTRGAEGFARPVAIKRIKRSISTDKAFGELFVSEARLAAKLHHSNVVQTLDFDRDDQGCFYLVMELIDGVDLRALASSGRIPVSACCFVVCEILRALDYAHELVDDGDPITIIHRDISPHNIMLGWQGAVKVVDFGIAKAIEGSLISRSGSLKGKVAYMSPEQVHGHTLDGRSDLFAVGIILHELLTGARLFLGRTEAETLSNVLTLPIATPASLKNLVPPDVSAIAMRLLERNRADRYTRAEEAIEAFLDCSISITKGRRDLETVLAERFPEKAPKRTSRLSYSPSPASSASFEGPSSSAAGLERNETMGAAATMPAAAELGPKKTVPNRPQSQPVPKRTFTGKPVAASASAPTMSQSLGAMPRNSRMLLTLVALGVAAAVAIAFFVLRGETGATSSDGNVELVGAKPAYAKTASTDAEARAPGDVVLAEQEPASAADDTGTIVDEGLIRETAPGDAPSLRAGDAGTSSEVKRAEKAVLTVRVNPWATVIVDGKDYGQTPQTIRLRHGKHRIALENPGLDKGEKFTLFLGAGESKTVDEDWR
ncbi:MAG: protein kinase [Myxococcales bacterium]|nr:protein kinase [Myxococcales bacterium]